MERVLREPAECFSWTPEKCAAMEAATDGLAKAERKLKAAQNGHEHLNRALFRTRHAEVTVAKLTIRLKASDPEFNPRFDLPIVTAELVNLASVVAIECGERYEILEREERPEWRSELKLLQAALRTAATHVAESATSLKEAEVLVADAQSRLNTANQRKT